VSWNDMLANIKQRVRRTIGGDRAEAAELIPASPRLEQIGSRPLITSPADVYENEREMLFLFDVPGGSKESLPRGQLWAAEYEPADWYRAFALPEYADGSRATSTITNGVLAVRVPKRGTAARLVPIRGD
jgi:HSP20 family molecular chaperone IbpA